MKYLGWLWFIVVQVISLVLMIFGWFILIPFSVFKLWSGKSSPVYPDRIISCWNFSLLDKIYGNWEDGVVPPSWYLPNSSVIIRVYMWTAWRNSTNNLRWIFLWKNGPWWQIHFTVFDKPWYAQAGWRPSNGWPVLSAGAGNGSPEGP